MIKILTRVVPAMLLLGMLSACDSGPGAKVWCWYMDQKPKSDWSASEAADYAKRCLFE